MDWVRKFLGWASAFELEELRAELVATQRVVASQHARIRILEMRREALELTRGGDA